MGKKWFLDGFNNELTHGICVTGYIKWDKSLIPNSQIRIFIHFPLISISAFLLICCVYVVLCKLNGREIETPNT